MRSDIRWLAAIVLMAIWGCSNSSSSQSERHPELVAQPPAVQQTSGSAAADGGSGEIQTTPSGLQYVIVKPGTGRKPRSTDTVLCHYEGKLTSGKIFDSSYERGEPISFPLNGVIPGWTEGLQLIGEGGEILLTIPGDLAYGPRGRPPAIPPNATLIFRVELLRVQ